MSVASLSRAAFPVSQAGRHPRRHLRGLLRLHSRYGPQGCSPTMRGLCRKASVQTVTPLNCLLATRSNRLLSGWNLPPLVIRAVGAHWEMRAQMILVGEAGRLYPLSWRIPPSWKMATPTSPGYAALISSHHQLSGIVGLTRFRGHLMSLEKGVHDAKDQDHHIRPSSAGRWSNWPARVTRRRSWPGNSSRLPRRSATGWPRPIGTRAAAATV